MRDTFFLIVPLLFSIVLNASEDHKTCNVKRAGKPPLFAKDCVDLGDGKFLITPCSSKLGACTTGKANIANGNNCESVSPSTPTPSESVAKALKDIAPNYHASFLDFSNKERFVKQELVNDRVYFANFSKENIDVAELSTILVSSKGKKILNPNSLVGKSLGRVPFGWQAFRVKKNEIQPIPLSTLIPECETSINDHE